MRFRAYFGDIYNSHKLTLFDISAQIDARVSQRTLRLLAPVRHRRMGAQPDRLQTGAGLIFGLWTAFFEGDARFKMVIHKP